MTHIGAAADGKEDWRKQAKVAICATSWTAKSEKSDWRKVPVVICFIIAPLDRANEEGGGPATGRLLVVCDTETVGERYFDLALGHAVGRHLPEDRCCRRRWVGCDVKLHHIAYRFSTQTQKTGFVLLQEKQADKTSANDHDDHEDDDETTVWIEHGWGPPDFQHRHGSTTTTSANPTAHRPHFPLCPYECRHGKGDYELVGRFCHYLVGIVHQES